MLTNFEKCWQMLTIVYKCKQMLTVLLINFKIDKKVWHNVHKMLTISKCVDE